MYGGEEVPARVLMEKPVEIDRLEDLYVDGRAIISVVIPAVFIIN